MLSRLSKITNPENASHFIFVKGPQSNKVNDLLINETIPFTLYKNLMTFGQSDKKVRTTRRSFKNDN